MSLTTPQATDECMAVIAAVQVARWPGLLVRWEGVVAAGAPPAAAPWWWPTMRHNAGKQGSLSGATGVRRWRRNGFIIVQCFAPLAGGGKVEANAMACAIRDAYQGTATPGGVWFRNATTKEVGPDASWYQVNAAVDFQYDELR